MPSFKSDEEFLTYISMGAIGVRGVIQNLEKQGRRPLLLERGSNDFKLWKRTRIKGLRIPDILCVDTGRRVESRAKTSFEISGSHSTANPQRAWDYGLHDTDYVAIPVCIRSGARPIDWKPLNLIQYVLVGDLREAQAAGQTLTTSPKGAQQGSEIRVIWPSSVASADGVVQDVTSDRVQFRVGTTRRLITLATKKRDKQLRPLVETGQAVAAGQVLASVVPVYTTVSAEPVVDERHYLRDLTSFAESIRFTAAKALGLFPNDPAVEEALAKHLQDTSEHIFVRLEVAAGLARFGDAAGWDFLKASLASNFSEDRLEAVIVLAEIDRPEARQFLFQVLSNREQDAEIRAGAAWALGEHRNRDALAALVSAFAESSMSIRTEAARALAKLVPAARAAIVGAFGSADEEKRPGISWALGKTGGAAIRELLPMMVTEDARQWAAYIIGTQSPEAYVEGIEELRQHDPEVYFAVTLLWKILSNWVFELKEYG